MQLYTTRKKIDNKFEHNNFVKGGISHPFLFPAYIHDISNESNYLQVVGFIVFVNNFVNNFFVKCGCLYKNVLYFCGV